MASPRHLPPSDPAGHKDEDCPALCPEGEKSKRKPAAFNLRKSIAWNPAFFTEQGVLDNLELSVLTGSQIMPNWRRPSSGTARSATAVADNSHSKLPAKCSRSAQKQGRKLFPSEKTPQRDQGMGTQNKGSSTTIQKSIPRLPSGRSIQKKVQNSSPTPQMSSKKSQPSRPTVPTTGQIHRVPGLPPKSKIDSVTSGSAIAKDVVPTITTIREETNVSVKCKNFLPHPQSTPSSSFSGPVSTFAKPSALRMPSPSVGFFAQENAHVSHGNAAKRNVGRCFVGNASPVVKPLKYKQPEDLQSAQDLRKPPSTNCMAASNLVPPASRESNPNTFVAPEKEPSAEFIIMCSTKSGNANNQERAYASFLLDGNGDTIHPLNPAKNGAARNSMPVVCSDISEVERRGISEEIEPSENSYPLKAVLPSPVEPVEDSSPKSTCPSIKPIVGGTSTPSSISSRVCSSGALTYQSKSESVSSGVLYLGNYYIGETTHGNSLFKGESCTPGLDFSRGFDSHDHKNTKCAAVMEPVKSTVCADQAPCCGTSKGETPALADYNSDFADSLCNEAEPASSEEPNADSGMELETNNASAIKETPSLHVRCEHNHNYRSTEPSSLKLEAPTRCVGWQHALSVESNMEDKMVLDTDKLPALEGVLRIENMKAIDRSRPNRILKDHMTNLIPFSEEWLAVMEACGQEVLEQQTGAVQNSPPYKTAPEPSPWSPVKRKAQNVGPFECTKYSKSVRTSGTP